MATTKITNPDLFDLASLNTALQLPSGTTAERPTSPSTGEWRYNTTTNLVEFWDGGAWRDLQSEDIPPIPSENFNTVTYTGNSSTQSITGVGFQPDFVWIKERSAAESHRLFDSTRGATKRLFSDNTNAESTATDSLTSFDADGFSLGSSAGINENSQTYVAWCWKSGGGTTSSNTDGTITSTVQANTKAGFSIVKYTGNATSGATIGHGLSAAPEMIIIKNLDTAGDWVVGHTSLGFSANKFLKLNLTSSEFTNAAAWASTNPTSTTFTLGSGSLLNNNGDNHIAYCFHSVSGFSKFGSYTGNGSTNGPIINTGFEPAFILIKNSSSVYDWVMYDNKRSTSNPRDNVLYPNTGGAENSGERGPINFLSNGFQVVATQGTVNQNGGTLIYMAFAADPSAAPVLADSFNTSLYTGNGSTQSIAGLGFSPSLSWIKGRTNTASHQWFDTIRGATYQISSDTTGAQTQNTQMLTSFNTDGFSLGNQSSVNGSGVNYVAWSWKANPIPTINTDGTIQSEVSANDASGFSIVSYTGTGSNATVGHGLSSAPEFIFVKNRSDVQLWVTGSSILNDANAYSDLNSDKWYQSGSPWNSTQPTSSVFSVGTYNGTNGSGDSMIAYCFKSISGFSKIGSYTGTGSTGNSINVGFQPDWIMIKRTDFSGSWNIIDSLRGDDNYLSANLSNAEASMTPSSFHLTSTGFTLDNSFSEWNASGGTYIYMAFKQNKTARDLNFLLVAGGGGAGQSVAYRDGGGGGGAGGLRTSYGSTSGGGSTAESGLSLTAGTYTITVGAGGSGGSGGASAGSGTDSVILTPDSTSIISSGGGNGGGFDAKNASSGGSGGGAASDFGSFPAVGQGTTGQGFIAGYAFFWFDGSIPTSVDGGGGGGGAGSRGLPSSAQSSRQNSSGGDGLAVSVTGSSVTYAAGGRGTTGSPNNNGSGWTGNANTGDGGQGNTYSNGGAGASGVVVLRMPTASYSGTTTGSPTVTTDGSDTILTYTGSGTYVHS